LSGAPVSVIVAVKNGERFLAAALGSVLAQTLPPMEIVVVDGRSTDATAFIARSFPTVRHLIQPDDGLARARNLGIAAARHELIAFLDHDDLWEPHKLERQVGHMRDRPTVAYTLSWMRFLLEPGMTRALTGPVAEPRMAATPSALIARRVLFDQIGYFDPSLSVGCDADWFTRARDQGVPCAVLAEVLLQKRVHDRNLSSDHDRNRREMFAVARRSIARRYRSRPVG
jgi:glycosyltransferase involved in cell wall biosynthesis